MERSSQSPQFVKALKSIHGAWWMQWFGLGEDVLLRVGFLREADESGSIRKGRFLRTVAVVQAPLFRDRRAPASLHSIFSASGKNRCASVPSVFIYLLLRAGAIACLPETLFFSMRSYLVSDVVRGPSAELLQSPCCLEQSVAIVLVLTAAPC